MYGPGLYYITGLQAIPKSYFEAAEVEGAGFWRKIWTISLPRLRPIIFMSMLFSIIGSLQEFTFPDLMTRGGPNGASRTVVMYMFNLLNNGRYRRFHSLSRDAFRFDNDTRAYFPTARKVGSRCLKGGTK